MPKAGMSMEEGTIVRWLKKEGEAVEKGEPLLEIITDKVNMEIEAEVSGILLKILCFEDEVVPVTQSIAFIGQPGEELPSEAEADDVIAALGKNTAGGGKRKRLEGIRRIIAERMLKSHTEVPTVTLDIKVDITELSSLRDQLKKKGKKKITFNDFVLKATASALEVYPYMNASLIDNEILFREEINLGMAVALEEGLIVPVIKQANKLSLEEFTRVSRELAGKARDGTLLPDDCTGGTFTVTNLGMYDIISFTPIINPPECGILGVCAIEDEPKMVDDRIENRIFMRLSLSFDHRVVDGAQAALFLSKIKALLEIPEKLISDR
jgi:pyruvate dehydrogenase E2 component (dihydrolipoamide acetyltransferase)